MRMSEKKRQELYNAIHITVVDLRIELDLPTADDIKLFALTYKIWSKQKEVLGIDKVYPKDLTQKIKKEKNATPRTNEPSTRHLE